MNLVFIGASRFGLRCLQLACSLHNCRVTGVVTARQQFKISYRPEGVTNVLHADISGFATDLGLDSRVVERSMNDAGLLEAVKGWKPDAFLVVGWYHMIPKIWRDIAPAYGLHASLLPDYSGGAPLVWAMINGEVRTGITLFQMDDGVDTGPIVGQAEEVIEAQDTISTLYARIEEQGLELLRKKLPQLAEGTAVLTEQPKTGRRIMPQRSPKDGCIDWNRENRFIDRFIRAQTRPYPGAYAMYAGKQTVIWAARQTNEDSSRLPTGTVLHRGGECLVICGKGCLRLEEIEICGEVFVGGDILRKLPNNSMFENAVKESA